MATPTLPDLFASLSRLHLLEPAQLEDLQRQVSPTAQPKVIANELRERGWLTAYQVDLLLQGRGDELLLGSYVLLDKIGEGGMGAVFRARNWKLGRITAIKWIRKERLTSADAVQRFHREIRAAAQLDHPNVVRAYDADEVNGTHFIAMEFVDGIDLARLVREHGPLPPSLACEYIRQAALGLQHAHERGLVHRDIKPANLLLARSKGAGTIKVLDMGLARHDDTICSEHSATLTQMGTVMGTPDFMAPEQSISARTVDSRADLYSLGCSLYFLLTGSVPFPGGSLTEKLLKHQMESPPPIASLRSDVPAAVAEIVTTLMAKKPAERYQTPAELAHALSAIPVGQPSIADRPRQDRKAIPHSDFPTDPFWQGIVADATIESTSIPMPRKKRWALIGAAAAVLAAACVVIAIMAWPRPIGDSAGVKPPPTDPPPRRFALEFDGVTSHILVGDFKFRGDHPLTFECWAMPYRLEERNQSVFSNQESNGLGMMLARRKWLMGVHNGTHYCDVLSSEAQVGQRVHLAGVFDGKEVRLYVNGKLNGRVACTAYQDAGLPLLIGANPHPSGTRADHFAGLIDEVRISRVARYSADFTPATRFTPDGSTIVLYHFDEGEETIVRDASPNGYHGVIQGAKWVAEDKTAPPLQPVDSTIPPELLAENAWGRFAPGTWVASNVISRVKGATTTTQAKHTLLQHSGDKYLVERQSPGLSKPYSTAHARGSIFFLAGETAAQREEALKKVNGMVRVLDEEDIEIAGRKVRAGVLEMTRYFQGKPNVQKFWFSAEVPGALCRQTDIYGDVQVDTEVTAFEAKWRYPEFLELPGAAQRLAFSADGKLLAVAVRMSEPIDASEVHVYSWPDLSRKAILPASAGGLHALVFSAGSKLLAAGGDEGIVYLWEVEPALQGAPSKRFERRQVVQGLGFMNDGKTLVAAAAGYLQAPHGAMAWDIASGEERPLTWGKNNPWARAFALSPDGAFAYLSSFGTLRRWDTKTGGMLQTTSIQKGSDVVSLAVSQDGAWLAGGGSSGDVHLWRLPALQKQPLTPPPQNGSHAHVALSPDGSLLALVWANSTLPVRVWRSSNGEEVAVFADHKETLTCVAFSADGHTLAAGGKRNTLRFYNIANRLQPVASTRPTDYVNPLGMHFALIPKGKALLGGGGGKVGSREVEFTNDFYLGIYEVTQEEWQKVMGKNPSHFARNASGKDLVADISVAELKRFPVERVSWNDCQEFVRRLNERLAPESDWIYRLPTETEWEYACRDGPMATPDESGFDFYLGTATNTLLPEQANCDRRLNRTCKVGSYTANRLGLHDMHGNVREWCNSAFVDDQGVLRRAYRTGCWIDEPSVCRAVSRGALPPAAQDWTYGLRLARVPVADPWQPLFNGKDLTGLQQISLTEKDTGTAEVVDEDGGPALRLTPPTGRRVGLFGKYHLRFEYKVGKEAGGGIHFFDRAGFTLSWRLNRLNEVEKASFSSGGRVEWSYREAGLLGSRIRGIGPVLPHGTPLKLTNVALSPSSAWQRLEVLRWEDSFVLVVNGKIAGALTDLREVSKGNEKDTGRTNITFWTDNGPALFRNIEIRAIEAVPPEIAALPGHMPLAVVPFDAKEALACQQHWADRLRRPVTETNSLGMKFNLIPPGTFMMTAPDSPHEVTLTDSFYLGIHEVTQEQFEKVMGKNPSVAIREPGHPVDSISWTEADEFCRKLSELPAEKEAGRSYRLPSEAQWEYACRAGAATNYHFGTTLTPDLAQFHSKEKGKPKASAPVGSFPANAWGLHDMHGNVWEWCADWTDPNYFATSLRYDPAGPSSGSTRVIRSGGWWRDANSCRAASREAYAVTARFNNTGMRVLLELSPREK